MQVKAMRMLAWKYPLAAAASAEKVRLTYADVCSLPLPRTLTYSDVC
jgi:hypothetical protein